MPSKKQDQPENELFSGLSNPAKRALTNGGYTRLEQLAEVTEADIKKLHGMGPTGIEQLKRSLANKGLSFAKKK